MWAFNIINWCNMANRNSTLLIYPKLYMSVKIPFPISRYDSLVPIINIRPTFFSATFKSPYFLFHFPVICQKLKLFSWNKVQWPIVRMKVGGAGFVGGSINNCVGWQWYAYNYWKCDHQHKSISDPQMRET